MPKFLLLLHEPPATQDDDMSPDEIQAIIQEYVAWSQKIAASGHHEGGHKLIDEGGRILTVDGDGTRILDGPYSEVKEIVGGLFVIKAKDYDEAAEIASGCPHLRGQNRIELRQIDEL